MLVFREILRKCQVDDPLGNELWYTFSVKEKRYTQKCYFQSRNITPWTGQHVLGTVFPLINAPGYSVLKLEGAPLKRERRLFQRKKRTFMKFQNFAIV